MKDQSMQMIREQQKNELTTVMLKLYNAEVEVRALKRRRGELITALNTFSAVDQLDQQIKDAADAQARADAVIEEGKKKAEEEARARQQRPLPPEPAIIPPAANDVPAAGRAEPPGAP